MKVTVNGSRRRITTLLAVAVALWCLGATIAMSGVTP